MQRDLHPLPMLSPPWISLCPFATADYGVFTNAVSDGSSFPGICKGPSQDDLSRRNDGLRKISSSDLHQQVMRFRFSLKRGQRCTICGNGTPVLEKCKQKHILVTGDEMTVLKDTESVAVRNRRLTLSLVWCYYPACFVSSKEGNFVSEINQKDAYLW